MLKFKQSFFLFLSLVCVLAAVGEARAQDAEIEQLVREVSIDTQKGAISSYGYLMRFSFKRHKFGGRRFTRLYEAILPSRFSSTGIFRHPFILLEDSERNITAADIISARKEIAKELEKAEQEALTETGAGADDGGYWTMSFSSNGDRFKVDVPQLLRNSRFSNLQRRQIDERSLVSLDFVPKPGAVFERGLDYLGKLEGRLWIDEKDRRIIRIEGFPPGGLVRLADRPDEERQSEAVFFFLQMKVAEGFWFPRVVILNLARHPEIADKVEMEFSFSSYKRASVEVRETVDKPREAETRSEKPKEAEMQSEKP